MSVNDRNSPDDPLAMERAEVERAAQHYYHTPLQRGIDARTKGFIIERCLPYVRGPRILDLGYVDGNWTDALLARGYEVDVVEGAQRHVDYARERHAGDSRVRVFHALFQQFEADSTYDTIVAGDMLRYLPDPPAFLSRARTWLNRGGRLVVTVPNRRSLHRRVGAVLGLEASLDEPNPRDREVGNRRSYDRYELRHLLQASGYDVICVRGSFLKPLSSAQMEGWDDKLLRAFLEIGDELEDYCWFLWAVAEDPLRST
jgi:SAM-dependent methyltransferase